MLCEAFRGGQPEGALNGREKIQMRNFVLATLTALAGIMGTPGPSQAAQCTPGVDCYCDRARKSDAQMLACEDFEALAYHDDVAGAWYKTHPSIPGFRGGGSKWLQLYNGTAGGNWRQGQPSAPRVGETCAFGTCGAGEWRADDLWQANSFANLDVQRVGEQDDEIPGLTLNAGHDGQQWMAWRVRLGGTADIMGEVNFPSTTEVGFTALEGYSSNLSRAVGQAFPAFPWKHEEWGNMKSTVFMGNVGAGGAPFAPTLMGKLSNGQTGCESWVRQATVSVGRVECNDRGDVKIGSSFNINTDWPTGTWGCVRGHIKGLGSTSGSLEIWFNERKVFSMTNANFAALLTDQSFGQMVWNHYYNGNQGLGETPAKETFYRYSDNVHIRKGVPVSCASIGFNGAALPPSGSAPAAPVLLP